MLSFLSSFPEISQRFKDIFIKRDDDNVKKIINLSYILIFILFILALILLYDGSIDDYAPVHAGVALQFVSGNSDSTTEYYLEHASGFYSFLGTVMLITDLDVNRIPVFPLTVFLYATTFFAFVYKMSRKNAFFSLILSMITVSASIMGSHQIYIWMHGIGDVLLFTLFLLFAIGYLTHFDHRICLLIILVSISEIFMSYNASFRVFLFFIIFLSIFIYIEKYFRTCDIKITSRESFKIFLIILIFSITLLGLSKFVLNIFFKQVILTTDETKVSFPIEKFYTQYFGQEQTENLLLDFAFVYPKIITYAWIFKYLIYIIIIVSAVYLIVKNCYNSKKIEFDFNTIMFFTITILIGFYFISRLVFGQLAISEVYWIFIFSAIIVYEKLLNSTHKKILFIFLIILLCINLSNILIANEYDLGNKGNKYEYMTSSANWFYHTNNENIYLPDVFTYSYYYNERSYLDLSMDKISDPLILQWYDAKNLYLEGPVRENIFLGINYYVARNNVQTWNNLISFKYLKEEIESNPSLKMKIYNNKGMSIFSTWSS